VMHMVTASPDAAPSTRNVATWKDPVPTPAHHDSRAALACSTQAADMCKSEWHELTHKRQNGPLLIYKSLADSREIVT
jgi:hypothetical protein